MPEIVNTGVIHVTLPDGKRLEVPAQSSIRDVALRIGPGLGKACLGGKIDDDPEIKDLRYQPRPRRQLRILTDKDPEGLEVIRHSASHIMADAICRLWPQAKLTIGPATDERLLLRHRSRRHAHPRGPAEDRGRDGEDHRGRHPVRVRRAPARGGAQELREGGRERTRSRSSPASRRARRSPSTATATGRSRTSAAGRTSRAPDASRRTSC